MKFWRALWQAAFGNPRRLFWCVFLSIVLCLVLATQVELRTSRKDLAPQGDLEQIRMDRLEADFKGTQSAVAGVSLVSAKPNRQALEVCTDTLVESLQSLSLVESVYHKVPTDWLADAAIWLVPVETLEALTRSVKSSPLKLEEPIQGFGQLNQLLLQSMAENQENVSGVLESTAVASIERLIHWWALQEDLFSGGDGNRQSWLEPSFVNQIEDLMVTAGESTRLKTEDGSLFVVQVQPSSTKDDLPSLRNFVSTLKKSSNSVTAQYPECVIQWTGTPVMTVEEMDTVRKDSINAAWIALLAVSVLSWMVFRDGLHVLIVGAALVVGLIWSLGMVGIYPGHLNMITSAFISTLIGVGIAYGIHPVAEFELQRQQGAQHETAIRRAFQKTGRGIVVAATTTAGAFFSILWMKFPGFSEMGWVAGQGIVLCLVAMWCVLPTLLRRWTARRPINSKQVVLDRIWAPALIRAVLKVPKVTLGVTALITLAILPFATKIQLSTNIMKLLPTKAPSLKFLQQLQEEPQFSPTYNLAAVSTIAELEAIHHAVKDEPSISSVRSVYDLLPKDQERAKASIQSLRETMSALEMGTFDLQFELWHSTIDELIIFYEDAADQAFDVGMASLVEALEHSLDQLDAVSDAMMEFKQLDPADQNAIVQSMQLWWDGLQKKVEELKALLATEPPNLETLPPSLRKNLQTQSGQWLAFLYPAGNIYEPEALLEFVDASRRVHEESIGFPVMLHRMSGRITDGFYRALGFAALLVVLLLWLDFRSWQDVCLALVPLVLGISWMVCLMGAMGIPFNFANLVAIPLVVGVGIDNGVHMIHRWREEAKADIGLVMKHTGRAIWIASATTLVGFGALALADHRGLASLGWLLILGVGGCLIASTIVLPNLLLMLERKSSKDHSEVS